MSSNRDLGVQSKNLPKPASGPKFPSASMKIKIKEQVQFHHLSIGTVQALLSASVVARRSLLVLDLGLELMLNASLCESFFDTRCLMSPRKPHALEQSSRTL
jgi:hypothetical protein